MINSSMQAQSSQWGFCYLSDSKVSNSFDLLQMHYMYFAALLFWLTAITAVITTLITKPPVHWRVSLTITITHQYHYYLYHEGIHISVTPYHISSFCPVIFMLLSFIHASSPIIHLWSSETLWETFLKIFHIFLQVFCQVKSNSLSHFDLSKTHKQWIQLHPSRSHCSSFN